MKTMVTISHNSSKPLSGVLLALTIIFACYTSVQAQSKFPASEWMKKDTRFKLGIMREFIDVAKRDGVVMRFSPEYYVKEIDGIIENSIKNHDEKGLATSVGVMIRTIAAMDGDWDNGESMLEHAKKQLGPTYFEEFKQNFPQKYNRLLEESRRDTEPWKQLGYSENRLVYYDVASLSYVSKTVVRVWVKTKYIDLQEGLDDLKKHGLYKPDHEKYDHDMYLYIIDCASNTFAILADYSYMNDGTLIDTYDFPKRWDDIPPHSVVEVLSNAICANVGEARQSDLKIHDEANKKTD